MKKILAIDDQQDNLITMEAVINSAMPGCRLLAASSGKEGIHLAQKEQPDVILLDVIMPRMDGFEVCKRLKADESTKHIPVVMVTAIKTDSESRVKGLNMGADAFLSKPIDQAELTAQVNVMLRIKGAEDKLRSDKDLLDTLVNQRTKELQEANEKLKQDIIERKRLEEEMRKLVAIVKHSSELINLSTLDGKMTFLNEAGGKMLGIDPHEVESNNIMEVIPDHLMELVEKELVPALAKGKTWEGDLQYRNLKTGELIDVRAMTFTVNDPTTGEPKFLANVSLDITDRKKAEEVRLKMSQAIHNSHEVVFMTDKEGTITFINPEFTRMYGFTADEVVGKVTPRILKSGSIKSEEIKYFWDLLLSKQRIPATQYQNKCKDGKLIDVEGSADPILDDQGEIMGFIGIQRDVTDRKEIEDALHRSEERFKILFESAPDAIYLNDLKGTFVDGNKAAEELLGYSKEELIGKSFLKLKLLPLTELPKAIKSLATSALGKRTGPNEFTVIRKDGNQVPMEISTFPVKIDGKTLILGVARDISERKKAEEERNLALKKATESDRLKSTFLATMSHELRTPLNAVIGFSQLLDKESTGEEVEEFAGRINKSGGHLLEIIEDIFDITLIETGDIKLFKEEQDVVPLLEDVLGVIKTNQKKLDKPDIDIRISPANMKKHLPLFTDHRRLKQILINLMSNALKFTDKGNIELGFEAQNHQNQPVIQFFVRDTGIGIPKEKQELIFDVFRQVDDTHTRRHGGTGIGLSIVKRLTELLGGTIWIESDEGRGSTFYFTIPYEKQEVRSKQPVDQSKKKPSLKGKTILIVEDVESSYNFLEVVLKKSGVVSIWAKDGMEAINFCKENMNIDLVLMDINMPVMNGYDSTKQIKKIQPKLPVIAQTAYAIAGDMEKSLAAGCDDYITKPINKKQLMEKVEKWMR